MGPTAIELDDRPAFELRRRGRLRWRKADPRPNVARQAARYPLPIGKLQYFGPRLASAWWLANKAIIAPQIEARPSRRASVARC